MMKKLYFLFMLLVGLNSVYSQAAFNSPTTPILTIGTITDAVPGAIVVPVHAANIVNLGAFQFAIEYDPAIMTYTGTSNWYTGIEAVTIGNPLSGHLTFVWASDAQGINIPDNIFFNLNFTYISGTSAVSWSDNPTPREFADYDGNIFVPTYVNGSISGNTTPQPILSVTPANQNVTSPAGTTSFAVSNTGTGTMTYSATVTTGSDWLSISSGSTGGNNGIIVTAYSQNNSSTSRVGIITITAPGAIGSPKQVTVTQAITPPSQIERNLVIVELSTGTWCQYDPGAAMGVNDLAANGCKIGAIAYHNGDPFANNASNARNTYYNITGYPTAHFDGVLEVVGGDHTQSMYASYLPKYDQRIAVPSSFKINMTFSHVGTNYTVNAQVIKLASYTGSNLVFQLALTESDIIYSWQGQTQLNFVERLMVPDQNGTALDFSTGDTINLMETFTMNSSWIPENCELVAFVQANSSKEILQGIKFSMAIPEFDNDIALTNVYNIPVKTCDGIVTPEVKIKNKGANALTSATLNYEGNNGAVTTYNWTGSLGYLESAQFVLPAMTFAPGATNTFKIYTTSPNGAVDQNPSNDTITKTIGTAVASTNTVIMLLKLDANPSETSYEVLNSKNQVIDSHGSFTTPNATVKDTFYVTTGDCYRYVIHDAGGNGISGNFYTLRCGSTVVCSGAFTVGSMETAEFGVQSIGQPILSVTPTNQNVTYVSGNTSFNVSNTGTGTMSYSAQVTTGNDWLTISNGTTGGNSGTIVTAYSQNNSSTSRVGIITITAPGAIGSPQQVTVIQFHYVPIILIQNGTISTCEGIFYDSGGPNGNYQNNENHTLTFVPSTIDNKMKFNFTAFDCENGYDFLKVYDGADVNAPMIGSYTGATIPVALVDLQASEGNASGAITFHFTSDGTGNHQGWIANISCLINETHDMAATSVSGNTTPTIGTSSNYTIYVTNIGTEPETGSNYSVSLYDVNNAIIGTANGVDIAGGQSIPFVIPWIPDTIGLTYIYGKVTLNGDQNPANDQTPNFNVEVQQDIYMAVTIGTGTELPGSPKTPFDFYWKNSLTESLYFPEEIGLPAGMQITQIAYHNNFVSYLIDKPVKIFIGETSLMDLTGGWITANDLTLVYDGNVTFPAGINDIIIPLTSPYNYNGNNLVIMTNRKMDTQYFSSSDKFYSTTNTTHSSRTLAVNDDNTLFDPYAPPTGTTSKNYFPNTTIYIQASDTIPQLSILSVNPANQNVTSPAGTTSFAVSNIGNDTMTYSATVTTGNSWLNITNGAIGGNSSTIVVAYTENTSITPRTGTITVTAPGAIGSPKIVSVIQDGAPMQPILSVTPSNQNVTSPAGTTSFAVSNIGTGTMAYSATVTTGNSWLNITNGATGGNSGTIVVAYTENTSITPRTSTITVTAPGTTGSPVQVTVTQAAFNLPTIPILTIGTITGVVTGATVLPVHANDIVNLGAFQFSISYDASKLTYVKDTNWFPGITAVTTNSSNPGKVSFVWAADAPISIPDNTFFEIKFNAIDFGSSTIAWTDDPTSREFADFDGNIFVPVYENGSVTCVGMVSHQFLLNQGYQFISSYVTPPNPDMSVVLAELMNNNLSFVRSSGGNMFRKLGPNWVNNIGDWIVTEGYLVKMNAPDDFSITGIRIDPFTPINLNTGYQFISYFYDYPMDASAAFAGILNNNLNFIRNSAGNMLRKLGPNWVNNIGNVVPGEGYLTKMNAPAILIYPAGTKSESTKNKVAIQHFNFEGGNAADPVYTIYISDATINGYSLQTGDEIGVFDGQTLVGSLALTQTPTPENQTENAIPVFATLNSGEGFTANHPVSFKIWSASQGMEYNDVITTMNNPYGDAYTGKVYPNSDGIYSIASLTATLTGINSLNRTEVAVYPNPSNGTFTLELIPVKSQNFDVTVYNSLGIVVYQQLNVAANGKYSTEISSGDLPEGIYTLTVTGKDTNYIKKIVIRK